MLSNQIVKEISKILPRKNILSELEERYVYSQDSLGTTGHSGSIADAVVFPESVEDVVKVVKFASEHSVPVVCRGAGTNTVGSCIPQNGGIVLCFSKMNKILKFNPADMTITVQPGVTVGEIQQTVEKAGLFYPPDPSNLKISTIGGSIAQNSAGARCFKYGSTKNYIIDMKVVMANGEVIRSGSQTVKNAVGYDLNSLFCGSEGTLGIVVEATLKLIPKPEEFQVIMGYFDSMERCVDSVNQIISENIFPSAIDFMDKNAINTVEKFYPTGMLCDKDCLLLIEIDGDKSSVASKRTSIVSVLNKNNASDIRYSTNQQEADSILQSRRCSMSACAKLKPNVTTDDIIVPRSNLAQLLFGLSDICTSYNLTPCFVGHIGDGNIHPQIPIDFSDKTEYENYKKAKAQMYKLVADLGGTISAEHGVGIEKKPYAGMVLDNGAISYMQSIKKIFDPKNILNPYKIF